MKSLLPALLFVCYAPVMWGQLSVKPIDGSNDAYVYVDDTVLFVEDDVNLTENNAGSTQASIYLREQAQLVQGSGTTSNAGTGYISVMQDSRSDSYDYNFWSSPVSNSTGTGNQNFVFARIKDSLNLTASNDSNIIGSNNGSGSGMGGDAATNPLNISYRWLYKWQGTGWQYVGTSGTVSPGYGFTMKGTNVTTTGDGTTVNADANNQIYDFRGRPNNGDITITLQTSGNGVLSGNPYPSALDLVEFFNDNGNVDEVWFWDEDRSINSHNYTANKGGYGAWTNTGGNGTYVRPNFMNYDSAGNPTTDTGDDGELLERRFSPIGQGFFVRSSTGGTATFSNSQRSYTPEGLANNSQFKETEFGQEENSFTIGSGTVDQDDNEEQEEAEEVFPSLHIFTIFSLNGVQTHFRDMALVFNPDSTFDYDQGREARHAMDGASAEAYFSLNEEAIPSRRKLVIQTRPYDEFDQIPISFELNEQRRVDIISDMEVDLPREMYVWDTEDDTFKQFTNGKSATYILDAGTYEDRFFLVFREKAERNAESEAIIAEIKNSIEVVQNNRVAQLEISNPEGYDIKQANVFDISGKLVLSQINVGNSRRYSFPTANLSDGIYIVKLNTTDNVALDYKVSVYNGR